jgi:hypothetical protein
LNDATVALRAAEGPDLQSFDMQVALHGGKKPGQFVVSWANKRGGRQIAAAKSLLNNR